MPRPSSSARVSVAVRTVSPWKVPPSTTVSLSPSSMLSSTGEKLKVCVPLVSPAGIVTVTVPKSVKSVPAWAVPPVACTATAVSAERAAPSNAAVTVIVTDPPSSSTRSGASESCTDREAGSISSTLTGRSASTLS